jgi:hypothetical protein
MEIISWNMEFWRRVCKKSWKYNSPDDINNYIHNIGSLLQTDVDFILLQEINPYYVLGMEYDRNNSNIHEFTIGSKNIYYHELFDVLMKERPNDPFWGNAIIANNKHILLKNRNYSNKEYTGLKYFGYEALMCYDFKLNDGNIITLINHYKKGLNGNYDYEKAFFDEISRIVGDVNDKNMILLTGDFNAKHTTLENVKELGFVEKTADFENTMVEVDCVKPYHNDCVFVNNKFSKFVDVEKFPVNVSPEDVYKKYSDHYGFRSIINFEIV